MATHALPRRRPTRPARGTTLVELVLALAVTSVLLLGMGSAMVVAVRSIPRPDAPAEADRRAERAVRRLAAELAVALAVPVRADASVTLVLPDRDGDGLPEAVRWWREDAPAAPLRRQRLGADEPAEEVTGPLRSLALAFEERPGTRVHPGVPVRGPEEPLARREPPAPQRELDVKDDAWWAVPLLTDLPPEALAWEPTRVELRLRRGRDRDRDPLAVELRRWKADHPEGPVLAAAELGGGGLPEDFAWQPFEPAATGGSLRVPAGARLAAVLRPAKPGDREPAELDTEETDPSFADTARCSDDRGSDWKRKNRRGAFHRVDGRVWRPGPGWSAGGPTLDRVTVRAVSAGGREARGAASMAGGPPASGWRLRADFAADPAAVDLDADAAGDFVAPLGPGALASGVWRVPPRGGLQPAGAAAGLPGVHRLRLRMRDRTAGDAGGRVEVRFGRGGGVASGVYAVLRGDPAAQRLEVGTLGGGPAAGLWLEGWPARDRWVALTLTLDAAGERVAVEVDGTGLGCLPAPTGPDDAAEPDLRFGSDASGFEVDELELVGGEGAA